jgi:hypothetical protein
VAQKRHSLGACLEAVRIAVKEVAVKITGVLREIRTQHLPNISLTF